MVALLKDSKGVTIINAFQNVFDNSMSKPNKIWVNRVDKDSEFYNSSFKKWLKDNDIEMYSTHHEGKSVATERFIRTLKKIFISKWLQYQKMYILRNWMI